MTYFKVGDVVTLRDDLDKYTFYYMNDKKSCFAGGDLVNYSNNKTIINHIDYIEHCYLLNAYEGYFFTDEMFVEYDSEYNTYEEKLMTESVVKI